MGDSSDLVDVFGVSFYSIIPVIPAGIPDCS